MQLRKDPDVVARVLEEFDPSGTQDRAGKVERGGAGSWVSSSVSR